MTKHRAVFFSLIIISFLEVNSQVPLKWYFGQYAALDLSMSLTPLPFSGSQMNTPAGCAVSPDGKLYTNGEYVWGAGGLLNPPGSSLNGNMLSTQSAVIVDMYYADSILIFTTDAQGGNKGFNMHILSSKPVAGLNKILQQDIKLLNRSAEKIAVAQHCNKSSYWVITHGWNNDKFYAYHVGRKKIDTVPVVSQIGSIYTGNALNASGYMKASFQSDKIASVITGMGRVELFKFDYLSGNLSDPIYIENIPNAYGVEFDIHGNVLYVSSLSGKVYQFDVSNWNQSIINASKYTVVNDVALTGALQRNPVLDIIYLSKDNSNFLAAINLPYILGSGCNFVPNAVYLNGAKCEAGLPPVFPEHRVFKIGDLGCCLGDTTQFSLLNIANQFDSLFWDFGDTTTLNDTSTALTPNYVYPQRGNYEYQVIVYHCNSADTLRNVVFVETPPIVELGADTSVCESLGAQIIADLDGGAPDYCQWHDGIYSMSHPIIDTGLYWIKAENKCGIDYDSVIIKDIFPAPKFSLPNDTTLCAGDSLLLISPFDTTFTSIWNDSSYSSDLMIKEPSISFLTVVDSNNCSWKDDIIVEYDSFPNPNLGSDTIICIGKSIIFNGQYPGHQIWNNGSTSDNLTVNESGVYVVSVTNACGTNADSVTVTFEPCEQIIWVPNAFTPNGDLLNDVFKPYLENVNSYQLLIYNRFGQLLFTSNDIGKGWDGKFEGALVPVGVYVWKITFKDYLNVKYEKYGFVTLIL